MRAQKYRYIFYLKGMEFNQIKETCLYVKDLNATEEFYVEKLGLECFAKAPRRHVFFRAGTSVLLCFNSDATKVETMVPQHFAKGKQHLAFEVPIDEYDKRKEEIRSVGITITHEHTWPGGFKSFYFDDPDGHVLEVVPEGMWG